MSRPACWNSRREHQQRPQRDRQRQQNRPAHAAKRRRPRNSRGLLAINPPLDQDGNSGKAIPAGQQHATMRATVTTAGVRCTNPSERNGRNQTAVPTKKQTKKSSAAHKLASCAARTPATRNGGQRLIPVRNPSASAPDGLARGASPIRTSLSTRSVVAHRRCGHPTAYTTSATASSTSIPPNSHDRPLHVRGIDAPTSQTAAANTRYPASRAARNKRQLPAVRPHSLRLNHHPRHHHRPARCQAHRPRRESEHKRLSGARRKR